MRVRVEVVSMCQEFVQFWWRHFLAAAGVFAAQTQFSTLEANTCSCPARCRTPCTDGPVLYRGSATAEIDTVWVDAARLTDVCGVGGG